MSLVSMLIACQTSTTTNSTNSQSENTYVAERIGIYESVRLTTDLNQLSENEKQMVALLIPAAKIMDQ
ncbi:MAG: Zn-dependent hydrolase, partial [Bacteroidota bacterium]